MASYGLAKIAKKVNEELKVIEEVRTKLITKYGTTDDKGNCSIKPENPQWAEFLKEFEELMSQEVDIICDKVKLPETLVVDAQTLMALDKFVEV
jgi:hypothetical protein